MFELKPSNMFELDAGPKKFGLEKHDHFISSLDILPPERASMTKKTHQHGFPIGSGKPGLFQIELFSLIMKLFFFKFTFTDGPFLASFY